MRFNELPGIAITFVIVGVVVAVGLAIETDIQQDLGEDDCAGYWNSTSNTCQISSTNATQLSANSDAFNATGDAISGTAELSDKLPLIGLVIAFSMVLGMLAEGLFRMFM